MQLRRKLGDCVYDFKIRVLHNVGHPDRLFCRGIERMEPQNFIYPNEIRDAAPREWWVFDILEEEGVKRFRDVIEAVKEMHARVSFQPCGILEVSGCA